MLGNFPSSQKQLSFASFCSFSGQKYRPCDWTDRLHRFPRFFCEDFDLKIFIQKLRSLRLPFSSQGSLSMFFCPSEMSEKAQEKDLRQSPFDLHCVQNTLNSLVQSFGPKILTMQLFLGFEHPFFDEGKWTILLVIENDTMIVFLPCNIVLQHIFPNPDSQIESAKLQSVLINNQMSNFIHNDEDDKIPSLVPLKKVKKTEGDTLLDPKEKAQNIDPFNVFLKEVGKTPTNKQDNNPEKKTVVQKKQPNNDKIKQFENKTKDKISTVQKRENTQNRENQKSKENERSKFLIAEMLNKLSIKNLTEELYPVSNQVIEQLLDEIEKEIEELKSEAEKKDMTLAVNPNNLHLKKELEAVRREIGHCSTIKELYYEKMNYRSKIQILEGQIIDIRAENRDLKLKVSRGIETIENYKQNLPSDMEKQLQEKLNKCMQDLSCEKQMRESLEKNIESIIMNFKRLYDEADTARKIVTDKLREIEERERKLNKMKVKDEEDASEDFSMTRRVPSYEQIEDKRQMLTNSYNDSYNMESGVQSNFKKNYDQDGTNKKVTSMKQKGNVSGREGELKEGRKTAEQKLTLEQKIEKMRNNQFLLKGINNPNR